jgi:hypothetical protein
VLQNSPAKPTVFTLIYKGLENTLKVAQLAPSSLYSFQIQLCNSIACSSQTLQIKTADPVPPPWASILPKFSVVNSTVLQFTWSDYISANSSQATANLTYRLERSHISFAYPPVPLESGIRFHGQNYFKFAGQDYFPAGYPFFGLKTNLNSKFDSASLYYATSSFAQSEFVSVQLFQGRPWFLSSTQLNTPDCSIYLQTDDTATKYADSRWHDLEVFRLNNYAQIRIDGNAGLRNSSQCSSNQVVTDVTAAYVGGLPKELISLKAAENSYKTIQSRRLKGCMKRMSTILEVEKHPGEKNTRVVEKELNFGDAEPSAGEPVGSNVFSGCPISLESANNTIQFLGYGYLSVSVIETLPLEYQPTSSLRIEMDVRTQFSMGVLFYDFVLFNFQYVMVRLVEGNSIEVQYKGKLKYSDPATDELNVIDMVLNETFPLSK